MKKLRNNIFLVIFTILSVVLLSVLITTNISEYNKSTKEIRLKSIRLDNNEFNKMDNPIFFDNEIYVVTFDKDSNIKNIKSYAIDGLEEDEIKSLINKNVDLINSGKIGNLYLHDYVFIFNDKMELIIINVSSEKTFLVSLLKKSLILFILLEIVIVYVSYILTKWIVTPVSESFEKQKRFISDASHELKTPLAIIEASAETLENNPNETKWIASIKEESDRMNKLVMDLLELSKTENLKETEVFNDTSLSKLVEKTSLSFESLMFENNLKLKTNIAKDIMFNCNQDRIKELISILIDNAIKHSIKKSTIDIILEKDKKNIVLSVKNKGDEIPVKEREKIFERFYRVDKARNRKENRYGLGLSIAKNIVDNHKGKISVNCENGYTTFTVNFKQN